MDLNATKVKVFGVVGIALLLSACSMINKVLHRNTADGAPQRYVDATKIANAVPKTEPLSRYGNPHSYQVDGKRYYVLKNAKGFRETGIASWYGTKFHGQLTSNRETYNMFAMTAASRTLPIPTYVQVTNLANGKQVIVKVNDRGPFAPNRIIDLSYAAAKKLEFIKQGTALVEITAIDPHAWHLARNNTTTKIRITHKPKLFLQVGVFAQRSNAEQIKHQIANLTNDPIHIEPATINNTPLYRVQIGPIKTVQQSDQLQQLLTKQGFGKAIAVVG